MGMRELPGFEGEDQGSVNPRGSACRLPEKLIGLIEPVV
jgi:hypothetical protein